MRNRAAPPVVADMPFTAPYPVAICDVERGRFTAGPRSLPSGTRGLVGWFAGRMVEGRRHSLSH